MSTASPVRVAIIGAGIGREHLRAYQSLPERFEVRLLCDLDLDRAKAVRDTESAQQPAASAIGLVTDLHKVLSDPHIDLVDICLPPHLHFSAALQALQAGKHVVCEKPLVPNLSEADALLAAATAADRRLTPVFQYRYGTAMAQLRGLMTAGLTGRAYTASLETHWHRDADYYAVDWRGTWQGENGGAVLGHAIHNHDLLTTLFGPVAELSALCTTRVNAVEVEDCASISFRMTSGALASSSITLGAATDTSRLRLCFEKLTAESGTAPYAPMSDIWTFTARTPHDQAIVDAKLAEISAVHGGFIGFFDALADALAGRDSPVVTAADGRHSIELVAAIYQAARSGERVALPLGPASPHYNGWAPARATNKHH